VDAAKAFDVIVIGSGSGALVADRALWQGLTLALVDKGPLGGTCLNVGCVPSKMLIYPADRLVEAREAAKLGVQAEIIGVDFGAIMSRTRELVRRTREEIRGSLSRTGVALYEAEGHFVGDYTLEVAGERIRGKRIFIAAGARPLIPPIPGLEQINYLTNETLLGLDEAPESLIAIGGGFIGVEYAHFFSAMGSRVTILQQERRLVPEEELELSLILKRRLSQRMDVRTDTEAIEARRDGDGAVIVTRNVATGGRGEFAAERVLVATGRRPNTDLLRVEAAGLETTALGFLKVNGYLETNKPNIWAFGDVIGKEMFTHVANQEALVAWHNSSHEHKAEMSYRAAPHAVFAYPPLASVGLTEAEAKGKFHYLVGKADYKQAVRGEAMMETDTLAKAIVDKESGHIIGPYAEMLIQEVVDVMANEGNVNSITAAMHIHPALPEIVVATLHSLREPET